MKKKTISLLLVLAMSLSLAACDSKPKSEHKHDSKDRETTKTEESEVSETVSVPEETELSDTSAKPPKPETSETVSEPAPTDETSVYEPERYETDALTWDFDEASGTLYIHGEGPMRSYDSAVPDWEQYKDQILTISLDDGITSVGAYAFYNYFYLEEVYLPDSVEAIDISAFDYDWGLKTITVPASLKYVGSRAFYNTLLWEPSDLVFPEGCEYIGDEAFHSALKSGGVVSLPSTLKYLGEKAFTNAFISDFIVASDNEFYCSENHAIYTKDMKEIRMIAPDAEYTGEFIVPDGVEKISAECFNVIQEIETIYIPASVTDIAEGAFFSDFDLKEIIVDEANNNYKSENGLLLSKDGKLLLAWPDGIETSELIIPEGVERIGEYLFYGRTDVSYSIVLPESVKEIGTMSLPASISSLTLPVSLEKIDAYVFYNGIYVETIYYNGTEDDWNNIIVEDGNSALDNIVISMN